MTFLLATKRRFARLWVMRLLLAVLCALPLAGQAAGSGPVSSSGAALKDDDGAHAYTIEATRGPLKVHKGAAAKAHVEIVPRADAHVSPDAPISLTVTSGTGLKLSKAKFGRTDAKETAAKGVEFAVPFTAETAGKEEVKGTLSFFICTEKLCEKQKKDVSLAVLVE